LLNGLWMSTNALAPLVPVEHLLVCGLDDRAGGVLDRLASRPPPSLVAVFVVDETDGFAGAVDLGRVLSADPAVPLKDLVDVAWPSARYDDDPEQVASRALGHGVITVPVLDAGRLVAAVSPEALMAILRREHVEDLHRLTGIQSEDARTREALEEPPARRARHRLPWLLVGLAGSMVAAVVVSRFERMLSGRVAISYFVPAIVYLADAIGTQTEAVVVRGLSLSRRRLGELLGGELRTGLIMGLVLGGLGGPMAALLFDDGALGVAVGVSILVAGGFATSIGLLLPWLLQRTGSDPALGSGPVATIVQDVLSLVVYFAIATFIVGG